MSPLGNKNRELSQLGQFVLVTDTTRSVGIATTSFPRVGIGTTNPTSKFHVNGDLTITSGNSIFSGITTLGLGATSTPPSNSQLSFELTSNTNLRIKVRDSSGVIRSADITLS